MFLLLGIAPNFMGVKSPPIAAFCIAMAIMLAGWVISEAYTLRGRMRIMALCLVSVVAVTAYTVFYKIVGGNNIEPCTEPLGFKIAAIPAQFGSRYGARLSINTPKEKVSRFIIHSRAPVDRAVLEEENGKTDTVRTSQAWQGGYEVVISLDQASSAQVLLFSSEIVRVKCVERIN